MFIYPNTKLLTFYDVFLARMFRAILPTLVNMTFNYITSSLFLININLFILTFLQNSS